LRKLIVLLMTGSLLFAASSPSFAHAQLTSANPKPNAVLFAMPLKVNLLFTDDIIADAGGNVITLTGPNGKRIDSGATSVIGNQLTVAIKKSTALGKYTVRYRVVSEDGHPITGNYKFSLAKKK
jgi:hypothetical protein